MGNVCCSDPLEKQNEINVNNEPCKPMSGGGKAEDIEGILINVNNEPWKPMSGGGKAEDIEGILINPKSEFDFSGFSMIDMISNAIAIVDMVIKLIQNNLAKNQLLKAVCRRMQSLEPCFEELKSKNSHITKELVINLIHVVNRIKGVCEKILAGTSSIWEKFKDAVFKSQIEEVHELNKLLTRAQNDLQVPLAVETQKKMDQNFKKMFELLEKGNSKFNELKKESVLPLAKTKLTNEEAFIFWFSTFPSKFAVKEQVFQINLKEYIDAYHKVQLNKSQVSKIMNLIKGTDPSNADYINASQVNDFYCSLPLEIDWTNVTTAEKEITVEQKKRVVQATEIRQKDEENLQKKIEKVKKIENDDEKKLSKDPNYLKIFIESADYKTKSKQRIPISFRSFFLNPADGEIAAFGGDENKPISLSGNLDGKGSGPLTLVYGEKTIEMESSLIVKETTIRLQGKHEGKKIRIYFELDYWFGYFEEEGNPQNMNVFLKIVGNDVVGLSTDSEGVACWQGSLKSNRLNIKKKYIDKHVMTYQGDLKGWMGSLEIKGKWNYERNDGDFYLSQQFFIDEDDDEDEDDFMFGNDSSEEVEKDEENRRSEKVGEPEEDEETFVSCDRGHHLKWSNSNNRGGYACENCMDNGEESAGRWHCKNCNYNICGLCRKIPLENAKRCKNNHILVWNASNDPYPAFGCDICRRSKMSLKGRWHCSQCTFDLCHKCREREE